MRRVLWGSQHIGEATPGLIKSKKAKQKVKTTRQSNQRGFSIYIFDNSKSKSMVRSEKIALSGLVFARKIARMILIQNI